MKKKIDLKVYKFWILNVVIFTKLVLFFNSIKGLVFWLVIYWKLVGNELDFFRKFAGKFAPPQSSWNNWVVLKD